MLRTLLYQSSIDPREKEREREFIERVHVYERTAGSKTLDQVRTVEAICCPLCLRMFTSKVAFPLGN